MSRSLGLLAVCLFVFAGLLAAASRGGEEMTDSRNIPAFEQLEISGDFEVEVQIADKTSLDLAGDPSLVPYVLVSSQGEKLSVTLPASVRVSPRKAVSLRIKTPKLDELTINGLCNAEVKGVDARRMVVFCHGTVTLDMSGRADDLQLVMAGKCELNAAKLDLQTADLELQGACRAEVRCAKKLIGGANGASTVRYLGKPAEVQVRTTGVSRVTAVD